MEKVRVYWNLHKLIWSIVSCKSGLVIDYKKYLKLRNGYYTIWESGQKRVREEGKKNVHAFAVGYIYKGNSIPYAKGRLHLDWDRVKYNPYTDDYFMHKGEDHDEWNEIPRDWVGWIRLESLHHENGVVPRVYI